MSDIEFNLKLAALRRDTLLKEYDICSRRADFNTGLVWTWATLLVSVNGTALGILYRGTTGASLLHSYLSFVVVGLAGSLAVWWWQAASSRWHEAIRILYERMKDIETECDMWSNRYIDIHDGAEGSGNSLQARLRRASGRARMADPSRGISLKAMRSYLSLGVPVFWAAAAMTRAFAVVAGDRMCVPRVEEDCAAFAAADWLHALLLSCVVVVLIVPGFLVKRRFGSA